jgi:hypothetical protein
MKLWKERFGRLFAMGLVVAAPCARSQQVSILPASLSFTPQIVNLIQGSSSPQPVIVKNTGASDLKISSIAASGNYLQTNDCSVLSPGASCTIQVKFSPGTVGPIDGAITINDNAPLSPQVVSLSGQGLSPVTLSPSVVTFGTVAVGTESAPKPVRLTAAQNASVSITGISTSGDYAQTNDCPAQLKNGRSCTIRVVFKPTNNIPILGALGVSTAVGNVGLGFSVALSGVGSGKVVSQVSLSPSVLKFGSKGPNNVDRTGTVTLTNASTDKSLTIQSVSLAGSPNVVGNFPMYAITSNTCSGMLAPGGQCHIVITFSTTFSGLFPEPYPGAITIVDSDPTSPQVVGISAKQTEELTFSRTSVTFPPITVGSTSSIDIVATDVDDESGLLLGAGATASGDFLEAGLSSSCVAKVGTKCKVKVSFTPTQTGVVKGSITIKAYPECQPSPPFKCPAPITLNLEGTGK